MIDLSSWNFCLYGYNPRQGYYHTNQEVYRAFKRTFEHLGARVSWIGDREKGSQEYGKTVFFTIGGTDIDNNNLDIPLQDDCFYVLHNVDQNKYRALRSKNRVLNIQTFTGTDLGHGYEKLDEGQLFSLPDDYLAMTWATNLLPHEVEANKPQRVDISSTEEHWVGTIGSASTEYGNRAEIDPFYKACSENGIRWEQHTEISDERHIELIKRSLIAPAVVGTWQHKVGYIPCRIFKNISYGHFGVTNSPWVQSIFENKLIQYDDTYKLWHNAMHKLRHADVGDIHELMEMVKTRHTYVNRINVLIDCANRIMRRG